jgi:hypothetical protein
MDGMKKTTKPIRFGATQPSVAAGQGRYAPAGSGTHARWDPINPGCVKVWRSGTRGTRPFQTLQDVPYRRREAVRQLADVAALAAASRDDVKLLGAALKSNRAALITLDGQPPIVKAMADGDDRLSYEALFDQCLTHDDTARLERAQVSSAEPSCRTAPAQCTCRCRSTRCSTSGCCSR